ncbi:hypothetical protein CAI21_21660 [Alkalilimnicola ehrlichii]|uniref:Uncharacterized protein n=1 Tax=Alkalilimnicola ehrlichii TaxID=351052 RepID=A0A3E0WT58_9GAMM|nr:hypothetical protein [Alkalilimnicola ehrlichii]RFA24433.1 hypothetical protein CAI21_21660 [Alkalilimnicola ehrlichii]RFA35156.1 hypothetical protein CAL65_13715 [Alkalilimnicola ehrlichii]
MLKPIIKLETNEYAAGQVDEIKLIIGDLHFRKQITCERDLALADRLAAEFGTEVLDCRRGRE